MLDSLIDMVGDNVCFVCVGFQLTVSPDTDKEAVGVRVGSRVEVGVGSFDSLELGESSRLTESEVECTGVSVFVGEKCASV